jgi:cytochrome c553
MKRFLLPLFALAAATAVYANEQAAVGPAGDPAKGKAIAATVCVACHNADGNSTIPTNPKLAGQHAEYLFKQMRNFKSGERANPIMQGMISAYNEDQMRDLSAWFAAQSQKPEVAKNDESIEAGRKLFRGGNVAKGLPACSGCHGPAGAGIPGRFPRISGQFSDYIETQLKAFRLGDRANDPNKMMRAVADRLSDADIKALANYIAGLRER